MTRNRAKFISQWTPILAAIAMAAACTPASRAQIIGSVTRVVTVPDGVVFLVDGQVYTHSMSAIWPAGSKHTLWVNSLTQIFDHGNVEYTYVDWQTATGVKIPENSPGLVVITADPAVTEYEALFTTRYSYTFGLLACLTSGSCPSPNTIGYVYFGGVLTVPGQPVYAVAGQTYTYYAVPADGYVFAGWQTYPGGPTVLNTNLTVTVNGPAQIWAVFLIARTVNFATVPAGLNVLADHTMVPTPTSLQWGWDSTHSVGAVSPQADRLGNTWVFSSWSDGGASTHAITIGESLTPINLTATYVPAVTVSLATSPPGLSLTIDGRTNWPVYNFVWGAGETHQLTAPSPQTDSQGGVWTFASWSNGGSQTQNYTVPSAGTQGVRLTAVFTAMAHLTVTSSLPNLTVTVDGASCATPCDVVRAVGTQVHVQAPSSITAGPSSREDFLGWSDGSTGVWTATLGATPATISANYHLMNFLSATSNPPNGVTFTIQPGSPDGFYDSQTSVAVSVTALAGYKFRYWTGDLNGTALSGTVSMNAPRSVVANLDQVPFIAPTGVSNSAGNTPQAGVAPGSLVSVFGGNLAPAVLVGPSSPLAQTLGGTTVRLGDRLLPLLFVSPNQINLQLPSDVPLGNATLVVSAAGQQDVQADFKVVRNAPGLFQQVVNGQSFVLAFHADGSQVTVASPAQPNELVTLYGTGFGPTSPARPEGFAVPASPAYALVDSASVQVGDATFAAQDAFSWPGSVGVDVVRFHLGKGAPTGTNAKLTVSVNGQTSNTGLLPVQ